MRRIAVFVVLAVAALAVATLAGASLAGSATASPSASSVADAPGSHSAQVADVPGSHSAQVADAPGSHSAQWANAPGSHSAQMAVALDAVVDADNETNESAPGTRLSGIADAQSSAFAAEIDAGALRSRLANASTPGERALILDQQLQTLSDTLEALEERNRTLAHARTDGRLTRGEYEAEAARIDAGAAGVRRTLAVARTAAADLPAEHRERHELEGRLDALDARVVALRAAVAPGVRAVDGDGTDVRGGPIDLETAVEAYRAGLGRAPGPLRSLFGDERIELHVERANGQTAVFSLVTSGGDVVEADRGHAADPTLRVYTDHEVLRTIAAADDPWGETSAAVADGRIAYEGVGPVSSLEFGLVALAQYVLEGVTAILGALVALLEGAIDLLSGLV